MICLEISWSGSPNLDQLKSVSNMTNRNFNIEARKMSWKDFSVSREAGLINLTFPEDPQNCDLGNKVAKMLLKSGFERDGDGLNYSKPYSKKWHDECRKLADKFQSDSEQNPAEVPSEVPSEVQSDIPSEVRSTLERMQAEINSLRSEVEELKKGEGLGA